MIEDFRGWLNIYNSSVIVIVFSFVVIALDEYVAKPMRNRHWEKKAAAGDAEAQEFLRVARSAHVTED